MKQTSCLLVTLLFPLFAMSVEFRPLTVSVQTPHPGYGLRIERVDLLNGVLHVLARVVPPDPNGMFPMVISEASDTVHVRAPAAETRLHLLGRTWAWGDERTVENEAAYRQRVQDARPVEMKRKPPNPVPPVPPENEQP